MTEKQEQEMWDRLNLVVGHSTGLFRMALKQKAWIETLHAATVELLAKETRKPRETIISELEKRQKAAYQKLLEEIENEHPGRAAQLDNRGLEDIL